MWAVCVLFPFLSLSAVTAQPDPRSAAPFSSVPITQCQPSEQLIPSQWLIIGGGGGVRGLEWWMGMEGLALSQLQVMSAISVLELQFDNTVQFQLESKISIPPGFYVRGWGCFICKGGFCRSERDSPDGRETACQTCQGFYPRKKRAEDLFVCELWFIWEHLAKLSNCDDDDTQAWI